MSGYTNFNGYSHGDMRGMVQSMDSGGVMAASDPWRKASDTLKQIRTALNTASADATSAWEGETSDAFYTKMTRLANAVNNAAAYANDAAQTMQMMSEAIDTAKRDMPEEPSFWDKAGDAVSDTAKSAVGVDDEDTRTAVTDEKKAQAVAVMETLAAKYRVATSNLKPPPRGQEDIEDLPAPDSSAASAISGLLVGGGMGLAGGSGSGAAAGSATVRRSSSTASPQSPKTSTARITDSGISGGTANPTPKPKSPTPAGPGTGIDGATMTNRPPTTSGPGTGPGHAGPGGTGGGQHGGGGSVIDAGLGGGGGRGGSGGGGGGRGGSGNGGTGLGRGGAGGNGSGGGLGRGGSAFGASGMGGGNGLGSGAGGRSAGGGAGGSLARRGGGVVGEAGTGGAGRGSFTEGGSGLGRSRPGQGAAGAGGQGHGMPGSQAGKKKDKKDDKRRPDYLVEDEETWASGQRANPDVVE
ncbi:WXG100 family type VII secretion target [Streptomyces sp. NRRL B-24484]|uniref:WXG100 family type VII secretion target n=1 Tax=Streptomyces sp. NRRL B-24484 TaxID=1463833 RepID=UPI00069320F1|nr:hypothetical protein [Streptomyces sp. NRRL B-24484]